jgi:hypothetical protein
VRFSCATCSSPAVVLPGELHDGALVRCQGCNAEVATWSLFKTMATYTILAEGSPPGKTLTADPLDTKLVDLHLASSPT